MGNFLNNSFIRLKMKKDCDANCEVEYKCYRKVKKIWRTVEQDSGYYGFAICTVIFRNHPQYMKYFEDESIPEFVQEAKIKKKFTTICDTMCSLFIDYYDRPSKRDYLLGYIAMVHKDMGLGLLDFENFMSDLMEALITELPNLMTEEYILAQEKYLYIVLELLLKLMEEHAKKASGISRTNVVVKNCCTWNTDPELQIMYGYPLKYWLYKRRYWEYRKAIWASLEADMLMNSQEFNFNGDKTRRRSRERSVESRRSSRRRQTKILSSTNNSLDYKGVNLDDDKISQATRISWLLAKEKKRRQMGSDLNSEFSRMQTIQEDSRVKNSYIIANTLSFNDTIKNDPNDNNDTKSSNTQTTHNASSELQKGTNGKFANRTARERKRMRNAYFDNSSGHNSNLPS